MRAAIFEGPGRFAVGDVPRPECPRGGLLLSVGACAVCGTDVRIVAHGHHKVTPPQVLGHEVVGRVAESDAADWPVGARVAIAPAIGCGDCPACVGGRPNRCRKLRTVGYHYPGAFADWLAVPPEAVAQGSVNEVPDSLPDEQACLAEPLACCLNGQQLVEVGAGERVVIVGAGPIGVLHARLAAAFDAAQVIVVEQRPERRAQAEALGVPQVLAADESTGERIAALTDGGADVVIVAAPSAAAQQAGLGWLAHGGRLSLFGGLPPGASEVTLDANTIHYRELFVVGAHGSTPAQNREALALLASGRVRVDDLITARFPLTRAPEAVATAARGAGLKNVVMIGAEDGPNLAESP